MFQLQMWVALVQGDKLDLGRLQHAYHWNRNLTLQSSTLLLFAAVDVDVDVDAAVVVVVGALGLVAEELKNRNHGMSAQI